MRKIILLLVLILFSVPAFAQYQAISPVYQTGAPSGTCGEYVVIDRVTGNGYNCVSGVWTLTSIANAVAGVASSVDSEIALFSGTSGKALKRATTTGILKGTSGVIGAATASDLPSAIDAAKIANASVSNTEFQSLDGVTGTICTTSGVCTGYQASLGFTPENSANKDATGGYVGLTLFKINFKNAANTFTSFITNSNSAARTYTFQDRGGTIADNTDLATKLNLSGGTMTGALLFTDNTYDIGASGATRPRTGYFGTSVISPLFNGLTITNNGTNTLNIAAGKTLTFNNSLTLAGTDATTMTFPTTSATIARTDAANTFTGTQTFSSTPTFTSGVQITFGDVYAVNGRAIGWQGSAARMKSPADGVIDLLNNAETDFARLQFGGTTSSFPAIGRSTTRLTVGLADGSAGGGINFSTAAIISVASGTNQRAGNAVLVGGTVTVSNTTVTANTVVILTRKTSGGTVGTAITYTVSAGASFTITSDNILDTSTFSYLLIEVP